MKKIIIVLLAAFFAVSCSMQVSDKTGSLTLSGARGVVTDLVGSNASVRYSLTRNGKTIPLNGQSLLEVSGSDSVTIGSLIPGDGYKLGLSAGTKVGNNFVVEYYGYSETFSIAEGTNAAVSVALQTAPAFTWLTSTGGKSSAAVVGTIVNVLDLNRLVKYNVSDVTTSVSNIATPLSVNSFSIGRNSDGNEVLWLNTTTGLYENNDLTPLNAGHPVNIAFSRAVTVTGGGIGVYSGGGSNIGFRYSTSNDFVTGWQTAADYADIAEFLPEITQDLIKSIAVNVDNSPQFFYVATPLGTAIGSSSSMDIDDLLNIGGSNWLQIPGGNTSIQAVSTAGSRVFAASTFGLYTDTVTAGVPDNGLYIIPGTEGKKFVALESSFLDSTVFTAAVTDDNWVYLIQGNSLSTVSANHPNPLPAAAGFPLNAKPVFYDDGYNIHLILSGSNGSIDYQITNNPV